MRDRETDLHTTYFYDIIVLNEKNIEEEENNECQLCLRTSYKREYCLFSIYQCLLTDGDRLIS
jgi:hypothetical protein